jgi:hypothetical protein
MAAALPVIGLVTSIAGAGLTAFSSIKSGMEQSEAMKAQAEGARYNQRVAEQNALATEQAGAFAERQARLKAIRLGGTQAASYAKAGVLPEGSPLDVMAETAMLEEQDILATRYNYQVQASRYRSQAGFYGYEAQRQDALSGSPILGGFLKAGTSLLTTAGGLAKGWNWGGGQKPSNLSLNYNVPGSGGY